MIRYWLSSTDIIPGDVPEDLVPMGFSIPGMSEIDGWEALALQDAWASRDVEVASEPRL